MCISICRSGRWVIWKSMFDIKTISLDGKCLHNPTISFISRFVISLLAGSTNSQARIPWKISTIFIISICCTNFLLDRPPYCFSVNPLLVHLWLQFLCLHELMFPLIFSPSANRLAEASTSPATSPWLPIKTSLYPTQHHQRSRTRKPYSREMSSTIMRIKLVSSRPSIAETSLQLRDVGGYEVRSEHFITEGHNNDVWDGYVQAGCERFPWFYHSFYKLITQLVLFICFDVIVSWQTVSCM